VVNGLVSWMSDLRLDYRNTFSTDSGQRVLEDILASGYVWRAFPTQVTIDSHKLAMYEGARRLALGIKRNYDEGCKLGNEETRQVKAVGSISEDGE